MDNKRLFTALSKRDSKEFSNSCGSTHELMTTLTHEDNIAEFSNVVSKHLSYFPSDINSIRNAIPAKIVNFWITKRNIKAATLLSWAKTNPEWSLVLKESALQPIRFKYYVEKYAADMMKQKSNLAF